MAASVTGRLHGNVITLDAAVPPLEGQLVRVTLEPVSAEADLTLTPDAQSRLWQEWLHHGPQGPPEEGTVITFRTPGDRARRHPLVPLHRS